MAKDIAFKYNKLTQQQQMLFGSLADPQDYLMWSVWNIRL